METRESSEQPGGSLRDALMNRVGSTTTAIGLDLLSRCPGDRIPTVLEYAKRLKVGVGTVQRALAMLERAGVKCNARGRKGSYLASVDRARLWSLAVRDPLIAYMPLPYSRRYEGLATGIHDALLGTGVPFTIAYVPGARVRVEAIRHGYSLAVISALAFDQAIRAGASIECALDLLPGSYVSSHGVIRRRGITAGRPRVGVDDTSFDQVILSTAEFPDGAELVPAHYMQLVELVRRGALDAAVWALDAVQPDEAIEVGPLTQPLAIDLDRLASTAMLVVPSDRPAVAHLLREYVSLASVIQTQSEVLTNARPPRY